MTAATMAEAKIHPFESAGFGHAPFTFVGCTRSVFKASPDAPMQPGTSCDYCGTAIMDVYHVRSSNGVTFKVGSDCINKAWADFDEEIPVAFRLAIKKVQRAKADAARERRWARTALRCSLMREFLIAHPALMADKPHPTPYRADKGETLHDYLLWCLNSGPESSKTWACQMIEREQAK